MKNQDWLVGLDIGSSKIAVVVAEISDNLEPKIIGIGLAPSLGLKRGVVVDLEKTVSAISQAIEDAEMMAGVKIDSVLAGIAGDHIKSINSRGVVAVASSHNEIKVKDINRVIEAAKNVAIPQEREIIHILPLDFTVDEQDGIQNPLGMSGMRLEASVHIVTGASTPAQNIYKCIQKLGLNVDEIVLEPLASSYAVLSPEEQNLGVILIDLGGGTTDMAIFYEGGLRYTSVLGIGGQNVTNDIAIGLRTPVEQAEMLKKGYGCALASLVDADELVTVQNVGGAENKEISRQVLANIIEPRIEELFSLVNREVKKTGLAPFMAAGVVLTGGGSLLEGVVQIAEQVLDLPVKLGRPQRFADLHDLAQSPIFATSLGLVLYGLDQKNNFGYNHKNNKKIFYRFKETMKDWFNEYF